MHTHYCASSPTIASKEIIIYLVITTSYLFFFHLHLYTSSPQRKQQTIVSHSNDEYISSFLYSQPMHSRDIPPLNALRSFEAAARLGSFNQAAEELFVTPSAISHQIKSLEVFLGITLFSREKRRIAITTAGEKYLASVSHAFDEIDLATQRLRANPDTRKVNLSVVPEFLTRWLVPRLRDFQDCYPDVELRLSASDTPVDFIHSDIDMAIYFGSNDWQDVESHYLRGVQLVPVCSPKLINEDPKLRVPEDLSNHTLIHITSRKDDWERILANANFPTVSGRRDLTFSSTSLALGAAMEGVGIALSDKYLVQRELEYGQLVIPFDMELKTRRALYLVYQSGRLLNRGMQAFYDWLFEQIKIEELMTMHPVNTT